MEVVTLRLARACGIRPPEVRLELGDTPFPVALIQRFDRRGTPILKQRFWRVARMIDPSVSRSTPATSSRSPRRMRVG